SVMIIAGEAIADIDGVETALSTHDVVFVPANIPHGFKNASDTERLRVFWTYSSIDATRTLVDSGETGRIDAEQQSAESLQPVVEHVEIEVQPGSEDAFVAAAAEAAQHFQKTPGSRSFEVFTSHEQPSRMRVLIGWDSIAAHEHFRTTPEYVKWRELVGPHFAEAPRVEHLRSAHKAF
ncbi:antibiotic biosynthesis monooxygenase, partial [Agrococcus casei]|uniref:antibiotic biosynthesis monooxygenase n=1 Tax=Agrococcus casei TaxID=343512 RepID=UPI003F902F4C